MGGDRDGNPNVTSDVTREVVAGQRRKGASMLIVELDALRLDLSVTDATEDLEALAASFDLPRKAGASPTRPSATR